MEALLEPVRRLLPKEAAACRAIRLEALATNPEAFAMTLEKLSADPDGHFFDTLEQATVFGAFLAEELVGMAGLSDEPGTREAHKGILWGLYVRPGNRRTGLGRALLRAALAHARGQFEQVVLHVVSDNDPARLLYESEGFEAYGLERRALKHGSGYRDGLLMVRFLE